MSPVLKLSATSLPFSATIGMSNPPSQDVVLENAGGGALSRPTTSVGYGSGSGWLSVTATGTEAPYTLTIQVSAAGLTQGVYTATITVSCSGATNSPAMVGITFTLQTSPVPVIQLSPTSLSFAGAVGGTDPPSQAMTVSNVGSGTLSSPTTSITYDSGSAWLTATSSGSTAPYTVTVQARSAGLAIAIYTARVSIACAGAANSPQTIEVTLDLTRLRAAFNVVASNLVALSSIDSTVADDVFPNSYPGVGIASYANSSNGYVLEFAGLVRFDVSLLSGKTIESATLDVQARTAPVGSHPRNWKIGTIATWWDPASVTWNTMSQFYYYTATLQEFDYPKQVGQSYAVNVLATVQRWADGTYPNYGIGFLSVDYTDPGNVDSNDVYEFAAPTLTVILQ